MPKRALVVALAVLTAGLLGLPGPATAGPRDDADHYEFYFPADGGVEDTLTTLHADVLRPKGSGLEEPMPVILVVSPYTNHAGVPTVNYSPLREGPSDRFHDFLDLSGALERGYTYVMVDLPGFGGSGGCTDWGGVREQNAVRAAVEWAAAQPWSNGKVGLIGKSYDAWTGLMGVAQQPEGLAAVVAHAPVYSGYRYLYNNGVRFSNSLVTPALFVAFDAQPGPVGADPEYHANGAPQAWCYGVNYTMQQQDDPDADYWVERDLLPTAPGKETPVFLTQGFLEVNTKPDGAFTYWNGLSGTQNKAWFGQFDHDRGWDRCGPQSARVACTGREDSIEQTMAFFETHLKGVPESESGLDQVPAVSVQDNLGRYRAEDAWPPADALGYTTELRVGTYADDNGNSGHGNNAGNGIPTISEELPHDVWMAGEPVLDVTVTTTLPRANLVGNVYDIDPDGRATLVSRGAWLLRDAGTQTVELPLYGQDWVFEQGHRIAVHVSGANSEWWVHLPTRQNVTVTAASVTLPFLTYERTEFDEAGFASPRLNSWKSNRVTNAFASAIGTAERPFTLPEPLAPRPGDGEG
jgi:uncharacterized protein